MRRRLECRPADAVVAAEIHSAGGQGTANHDDISDWRGAERAVKTGIEVFGKLDGLVNNTGNLRKGDLADLAEADFDSLVRVHLKGLLRLHQARPAPLARRIQSSNGPHLIDERLVDCRFRSSGVAD
jgi:NAD(P)-dependent dehydrogenase (short-subunit alcohol dehydrogenase family)